MIEGWYKSISSGRIYYFKEENYYMGRFWMIFQPGHAFIPATPRVSSAKGFNKEMFEFIMSDQIDFFNSL